MARPESRVDRHQRVQRLLEEGKRGEAVKMLLNWQRSDPRAFTRNDNDYLLGRLQEQESRATEAIQSYLAVIERRSMLSDHAMRHLATIARTQADFASERQWLGRLIDQYPKSLWMRESRRSLAENLFRGRQWQDAIAAFERLAALSPDLKPETMLKIASAQIQLGRLAEAREELLKLIGNSSIDDVALGAARALDELDLRHGSALSEFDHFQRARIYQNNREFDAARQHFRWIVDRLAVSRHRATALFELGRGFYLQGRNDEAIEWYERVHEQFPGEREGEQGYYQVGHAHARAGRAAEAVERYESFIRAYPKSEWLGGAHLNAIDVLRTAGSTTEALEWCERTWKRFPGELAAVTALFSKARIHLAAEEYPAALEDLNRLLAQNLNRTGPSAPSRPEVTLLKALCLERLGRLDEAIDLYLSLPERRDSFYGQRATARLRMLMTGGPASKLIKQRLEQLQQQIEAHTQGNAFMEAKTAAHQALRITPNPRTTKAIEKQLSSIYEQLPAYQHVYTFRAQAWPQVATVTPRSQQESALPAQLAARLMYLGLYDEAARALEAQFGELNGYTSTARKPAGLPELFTLAVYLHKAGDPYRTIRIGERSFASLIPADFRSELLPADVAHLLYPVAFRDELVAQSAKAGVDPRFVLAVMRQESRFRADAKSPAGARGLLQFVPETANHMAQELQILDFDQSSLYQPSVAIRLGVAYLRDLSEQFRGNQTAMAAAFNSGEENTARWQARTRVSDEDRFVSEIGFRETKDYVRQVMSNYWMYQKIVDEKLNPF